MLGASDVVSLHVPLTEETHHLIDAEAIRMMKPTAVLVNTARGPVVDEDAVADALSEGRLWGAGFDVFVGEPNINPRLLRSPNATLLPHIGSATVRTRRAMCELACSGVLEVLGGGQPSNLVAP
jgi:lactate dehydrogenase-like 2-hydroxyacid dehydrogenase